LVLKD